MEHEGCLGPLCKECLVDNLGKIKEPRQRKNIRNASKEQERNLSKRFKAAGFEESRRVPGSGNLAILPGDVDAGEWFLGEAKETRTGKQIIDPDWYDKIEAQAKRMGRPWWVLFTWVGTETSRYRKVVSMSEDTFFALIERLRAAESELENNGVTN
jgi:Holliday junction resolvase